MKNFSYKYRIYPNKEQQEKFGLILMGLDMYTMPY